MPLADFFVTEKEIESAINEIKNHSACPQNAIPAVILKNCKYSLSFPLKMFFQKSFDQGLVPKSYKTQQIIPLFKKGMKTDPKNYRPISITSHIIKILERVIRTKLVKYFETNSILNSNQHGFRKSRSCITQLISHTTNILENLVNGNEVDVIYLDYSKAFDKIDHAILIQKLKLLQLPEKYLVWIKNFLTDRTQYVYHNEAKSYESIVKSGVPQGSVLGPLFFILFINDLPENISSSKIFTFADDTKIVHPISSSSDCTSLQTDLNNVITWSSKNNMKLNKDKFEFISYTLNTRSNQVNFFNELPFASIYQVYSTDEDLILPSRVVKDLGILINSSLNWDDHISYLCKIGKQLTGWILSVFYSRDSVVLMTLFNSLVRSKMEYGCQIWDPWKIHQIDALEQIQRYFTSKLKDLKDLNYWDRLKKLKAMSLQRRRERLTLQMVWKIKFNLIPNDVNLCFVNTKTKSISKAIVRPMPKIKGSLLSQFENSFAVKAAKLWNKLPPNIANIDTFHMFQQKLDDFLILFPDNPPIKGYYHVNSNSILDYSSPNLL